jgi:hypothetical protein
MANGTVQGNTDISGSHYWAFLSYSHRDVAFAERLHSRLETYRVPRPLVGRPTPDGPIPRRIMPVFRDRDELPSAAALSEKIREALERSRFLIVLASPWSAASAWVDKEVRTFKAMGRADRVLTIIIDGDPNASDRPGRETQACFCPALRFQVDADGVPTTVRAEPLAADARTSGDGFDDALLKLIAGLLGVGFDQLKRRELIRRRRRRLAGAVFGFAAAAALAFGYAALADLQVAVPGGVAIRTRIDRWNLSVFRPVAPEAAVAKALADSRAVMRQRLLAVITAADWFHRPTLDSVWEYGQIATALARNPAASGEDIALAARELTGALDIKPPIQVDGKWQGWTEPDDVIRAESSIWMLMGLSAVIPRAAGLPPDIRDRLVRLLGIAQAAAELCVPLDDGGWNDVPGAHNRSDHNLYSTALALHALLDLKEAGLCWQGDCARRDRMIDHSAGWLVKRFIDENGLRGWRFDTDDDQSPNATLSEIVLGALGRAVLISGFAIPPAIRTFAYDDITALADRPYLPSSSFFTKFVIFDDWHGTMRQASFPARLFWLPWSFDAATVWRKLAEHGDASPEIRVGLARALGHMAVTLADPARHEMRFERTRPFVIAETMNGLDDGP